MSIPLSKPIITFVAVIMISLMSVPQDSGVSPDIDHSPGGREIGMEHDMIFDQVVEVPPGGETRVDFGRYRETTVSGYAGVSYFDHGKLGEASSMLPDWLRTPFKRNMIETASPPISLGTKMKPSFGDIDGDGDDDLIVGVDGKLYLYENVGWEGHPILIPAHDDMVDSINREQREWICPSLIDFNMDGRCEILYGTEDQELGMAFLETGKLSTVRLGGLIEPYTCPTLFDLKNISDGEDVMKYEYTLICGNRRGDLYTFGSVVMERNGCWNGFHVIGMETPDISGIMPALNFSAPLRWIHDPNSERAYPDLVVGSGEGTLRLYRVQSYDGETIEYSPLRGYFENIIHRGPIRPANCDLDGDGEPDIILGCGENNLPSYVNLNYRNQYPYWAPSPTTPTFEVENYKYGFRSTLGYYDEEIVSGLLGAIINPQNPSHRDEIGFACTYTPPSNLRMEGMDLLLSENAYHIYSRDGDLKYVRLKEYTGDDYYTTAVYMVEVDGNIREFEIPRDVYYWGIVHPRVTEETVAYINPETGGVEPKGSGGRFWREYVYSHADEEYPPGPNYPDDWSGRKASYPVEFNPPLLKEVLEECEILWDLMPYDYPKGIDNEGKNNGHHWDYRDHAIEKVSHWVEKTLPINQQESPDDERPNQPVRIAATHNGNCGELQDLTIAAARSALIPARGILMPGEDHVWSEFYMGGWHQWDNYWSDGGGVVADQMNYWWGWGERGGSGLMSMAGDGEVEDVGDNYRPVDITGSLEVKVVDRNGNPVDGARVMVLSHWLMEQTDVSVGPYQGPPPATVPMPSIWGYTDMSGICKLNVWHQNFHVRVVSDIGSYVSDKFQVGDRESVDLLVELQGEMPISRGPDMSFISDDYGSGYIVQLEAWGGFQTQTDFQSGGLFREEVRHVRLTAEIMICSGNDTDLLFNGELDSSEPITRAFWTGGRNASIVLNSTSALRTTSQIRVRIFEVEDTGGEEESVIITNGKEGLENGGDDYLRGIILNPRERIINLSLVGLDNNPTIEMDESTVGWAIPWSCSGLSGKPEEINRLSLKLEYESGSTYHPVFSIRLEDTISPVWTSAERGLEYPWGSSAEINIRYDNEPESTLHLAWIGLDPVGSRILNGHWNRDDSCWVVDSSDIGPGKRQFRSSATDTSGNVATLRFDMLFVPRPPNLTVSSPRNGSMVEGDEFTLRGKVRDDVSVSSLILSYRDRKIDIEDDIDDQDDFSKTIDVMGLVGPLDISIKAVDNVGLESFENLTVEILPPPDTSPPAVEIIDPNQGERIDKGDQLLIRGTAVDDRSISSLILETEERSLDLLPVYSDPSWRITMDTSDWEPGDAKIEVTAMDGAGNRNSRSVTVTIYSEATVERDREDPEIEITSPKPGDVIVLGDQVILEGTVTDDIAVEELMISLDRGYTTIDITDRIGPSGYFTYEIDTDQITDISEIDTSVIRSVLEDYPLMVFAMDGTGKDDYEEVSISLEDREDPVVRSLEVKSDSAGRLRIEGSFTDNTAIDKVVIHITSPDGITKKEVTLRDNQIVRGGGRFSIERSIDSPSMEGVHMVDLTVYDPWENSVSDSKKVNIDVSREIDGGPEINLRAIITVFVVIAVLLVILYLAVRYSKRTS